MNFFKKDGAVMISYETSLGTVEITSGYFSDLVGSAASSCFGVVEMSDSDAVDSVRTLLGRKAGNNRGVRVKNVGGKLFIELHIVVLYGVNISAIVKSIIHKVKYTVEKSTGLCVGKVSVFVDKVVA
jgi:uncharacterized alkaline shock family protein YloU